MDKVALRKFKEAQRKIDWWNERIPLAEWLYRHDHWESYSLWAKLGEVEQERYCRLADEIFQLGYRRVKEKPPFSAGYVDE